MKTTKKTIRNQEIAVALSLAMLLGITGCAGKEADPVTAEDVSETQAKTEEGAEDSQEGGDSVDASGTQPDTTGDAEDLQEEGDGVQSFKVSEGTEHLGGKIWKLETDGMTFAHTSLVEDSMVTMLDAEDAEKIRVKFTEDTKVERWTIQGGCAGIDMQDAAFSDLKEGMGVELEGYYDGETFVAAKVIMEDYV